jgi:hypothetical protein
MEVSQLQINQVEVKFFLQAYVPPNHFMKFTDL